MLVKFISIQRKINGMYTLSEVFLNPKHIVMIEEAPSWKRRLSEGQLPSGLHESTSFSKVTLSDTGPHSGDMVLVGAPKDIQSKILKNSKQILRG